MPYLPPLDQVIASSAGSSIEILKENPARRYALFVNDSDTVMYLRLGQEAAVNRGIRLNASGGSYEINSTNLYPGRICFICSAASKNLMFIEW